MVDEIRETLRAFFGNFSGIYYLDGLISLALVLHLIIGVLISAVMCWFRVKAYLIFIFILVISILKEWIDYSDYTPNTPFDVEDIAVTVTAALATVFFWKKIIFKKKK